jgi:hypothetical protein
MASTLRSDLAMLEKSRAKQEEIRRLNKMPDGDRLKKSPPPATVRAAGGGENETREKGAGVSGALTRDSLFR